MTEAAIDALLVLLVFGGFFGAYAVAFFLTWGE